jgi:hypothetical protein
VCPLADLVIDAMIEHWAQARHGLDTEGQIGALRSAAKALVAMPPMEAAHQAGRLAALFIRRYDWPPDLVNTELITAVEQRYETPTAIGSNEIRSQRLTRPATRDSLER